MFLFPYRMLRITGDRIEIPNVKNGIGFGEDELSKILRRHAITAGLKDDISSHQVGMGFYYPDHIFPMDMLYFSDGCVFKGKIWQGDSWYQTVLDAKRGERLYLTGATINHDTLAAGLACILVGDTGWMGDEWLMYLVRTRESHIAPRQWPV